ncbi:uncharacterized protein V1518DRAFT_429375 [Limtongia smithiae]|uniref:uncharacterized protein n=1 Tax=Limtongia smithiae TaxID=1125753 RepID=UPI0034CE6AE3
MSTPSEILANAVAAAAAAPELGREVDTCRICRGEGTVEEPLFHPCKCSGSIKFVHQDCLIEWLQHSQRKQSCELCKTPFKFTKLYAPDMPSHIPALLFTKSVLSHIRTSIFIYIRLVLVCFVWLGWLPLSTRYALRFYFWVSDEMFDPKNQTFVESLGDAIATTAVGPETDIASALVVANVTEPNFMREVIETHLTTNPVVSKILADTVEGQAITGLVVLVFVIVFLIREWVLQNAALNQERDVMILPEQLQAEPAPQRMLPPLEEEPEDIVDQNPLDVDLVANDQRNAGEIAMIEPPANAHSDQLRRRRQRMEQEQDRIFDFEAEVPQHHDVFQDDVGGTVLGGEYHGAPVDDIDLVPGRPQEFLFQDLNDNDHEAAEPIELPEQLMRNEEHEAQDGGFWDLIAAWFRDNVFGAEADVPMDDGEFAVREQLQEMDFQRNLEELEEEADDFDGVLELIGMRGPVPVLFQNGIFSTVLITGLLAISLWVPYVLGKFVLLLASHPVMFFGEFPLMFISFWANQFVDAVIVALCYFAITGRVFAEAMPPSLSFLTRIFHFGETGQRVLDNAWGRISERYYEAEALFSGSGTDSLSRAFSKPEWFKYVHGGTIPDKVTGIDRAMAIFTGYILFTILGALYLSKSKRMGRYRLGRALERMLVDGLRQAGAILKVIVIIGAELVLFPLFCGALLDISLLPLFEDATVAERWEFTLEHPLVSTFMHWFVGTCYMFHFALFVSMCREIVRPGVLYFIRDPNDVDFHPIRDILDRPVLTQLRKIAISAGIYCTLITVCLGSVVYGIRYVVGLGIFPLRWAWGDPLAEFPVNFLCYHFFVPIALKFFRPARKLKSVWQYFFRKASSWLRMTSFMFNEPAAEEQGTLVFKTYAAWMKFVLSGGRRDKAKMHVIGTREEMMEREGDAFLIIDGEFMRVPNSDSVHVRKGRHEFVAVDKSNRRLDGKAEMMEEVRQTIAVYAAPHFRARVTVMLVGIWVFATATGLLVALLPLAMGRWIFAAVLPEGETMNDIYSFAMGAYIIGAMLMIGEYVHKRRLLPAINVEERRGKAHAMARRVWRSVLRALRVAYVAVAVMVVIPELCALVVDFYIALPLHTYFLSDEPIFHFSQAWAVGVLYSNFAWRLLTLDQEWRWQRAYRQAFARGMLNPNVRIATQKLILPLVGYLVGMMIVPLPFGFVAEHTILRDASPENIAAGYRYMYPLLLASGMVVTLVYVLFRLWNSWKVKLRDEVYLVGEQLHNHDD